MLFDQIKKNCAVYWLCNTDNLIISFKNSAVNQGGIYAGLKKVFELQFNIEFVQGNMNHTVQNKMWL